MKRGEKRRNRKMEGEKKEEDKVRFKFNRKRLNNVINDLTTGSRESSLFVCFPYLRYYYPVLSRTKATR